MEGAFNDAVVSLAPGADPRQVIDELDRLLEPYGSVGAIATARPAVQPLPRRRTEPAEGDVDHHPHHLFRGRGVPAQRGLGRLVTAQREQIAAFKALGFPTAPLVLHYLKLVAVIVLFGSALGLAAGFAVR